MSISGDAICIFFRKDLSNKLLRKRKLEDDDNGGDEEQQHYPQSFNKPKKPLGDNKLYFSTSTGDAALETETDFSRDARAIRERVLKQANDALKGKAKASGDKKVYKGIHGYTDYKAGFRREQTVAGRAHGLLRASAHIRLSARFDYQPDICKDYQETGYCGFGYACKFMHDRGL